MVGSTQWRGVSTSEAVATLRSRWDKGVYLQHLLDDVWSPIAVPLRTPTARQLGENLAAVADWAHTWRRARGFRVETVAVGGRLIGTNDLPVRAWVDDPESLWRLLAVTRDVEQFRAVLEATRRRRPELTPWLRAQPLRALRLAARWTQLLDVVDWMVDHAGPQVQLRQIDVPGVDTKFVERHRSELGELLDVVLPADRIDATHPRSRFVERYRLARKPSYVRLRRLDGGALLPHGGPAELALRVGDLAATPLDCAGVVVVENEITYLALPAAAGVIAVLGDGYAVTRLAPVAWMRQRPMAYWSDIDTHGLVMLDRMRGHFAQVSSLLMDAATLVAHETHWEVEGVQAEATPSRLTPDEAALYRDLVENRWGNQVRLEQERIRFSTVADAVTGLRRTWSVAGSDAGAETGDPIDSLPA